LRDGKKFPSLPTVYRHIGRSRNNTSLICPNDRRGNRKPRHPPELEDHICAIAEALFLQEGSKWNLKNLTERCRRTATAKGLLGAGTSLSTKYVRKIVVTRLNAMPEVTRLHRKERAAKSAIA